MAPYWSRACLKSITVAFQVCPVTARVGALTARPCSPRGERSLRFVKVSRVRPKGVTVLTIAARLEDSAGRLSRVRVAYANMGPVPVRASAVERALEGRRLERADVDAAAAVAADGCTPPTDAVASSWYRREVVPVHLARLLLGAV